MGPRRSTARLLMCILAVGVLFSACGGDDPAPPADAPATEEGEAEVEGGNSSVELSAVDNSFSPASFTVTAGSNVVVEFTNGGSNPHTFTSDALDFDTGTVDPGGSATVTFEASAGTAEFFCSIHAGSGMTGTIVAE